MTTPDPRIPGKRIQARSRLAVAWLTHRLGFGSIRGRYLLVAGFFVAIVLASGWAGQMVVDQTAHQSFVNVTEREGITRLLNRLSDDIWLTETALQSYLLSPGKQQRAVTLDSIDRLIADTGRLSISDWIQHSSSRREQLQRLSGDTRELRRQSDHLMEIRADAEKLFPAMRYMNEKLLPNNVRFLTLATLAMDEAREQRGAPSQQEIHALFAEARYAWSIMSQRLVQLYDKVIQK